tara:strand:+ start:233143 stop:234528 length:1386 start_codon:yes stop_codon:yes gene_type:complete
MDKQAIKNTHENIIIGGGIVGAGILRELTLRQENTLLIEKGDFSSQTSQSSSKMLHGGIRYLENFDFALVREALKEKKAWTDLTPHLTKEEMFYIPVYKESKWPLFFVRIGLFIYDLLSFFKNPKRKVLNAKETLKALPNLNPKNLKGAGVYSDAVVEDSKLALECIYDSLGEWGSAINYSEVEKVEKTDGMWKVDIRSTLDDSTETFFAKNVIFATGPFTDQLLKKLNIEWQPKMILSKGSHIWLKREGLELAHPMVLQTKDNRVIFVIPQRDAILVGTTEKALEPNTDIFNIQASEEEINYLIDAINQYFPTAGIDQDSILSTFAGVRPLVAEGNKARGKVSRQHKVFSPDENMYVIVGGKYTTFRVMAEDVVKKMHQDQGRAFKRDLSLAPLKKRSRIGMYPKGDEITEEEIKNIILEELPKTSDDIIKRRLSMLYPDQLKLTKAQIEGLIKEVRNDN